MSTFAIIAVAAVAWIAFMVLALALAAAAAAGDTALHAITVELEQRKDEWL